MGIRRFLNTFICSNWFVYLAFLAAVSAVFFRTTQAGFLTWDDNVLITGNPILQSSLAEAVKLSFSTFFHGDFFPATLMNFWVDNLLFDLNPQAMHIENLVLHILNGILVFHLLKLITKKFGLSFLIAGIFLVHPAQVESVMWLSERKGLLSGFFNLSSTLMFILHLDRWEGKTAAVISLLCFAVACLAKTNGILLPLLLFSIASLYFARSWKESAIRVLPYVLVSACVAVIRLLAYRSALGEATFTEQASFFRADFFVKPFNAISFYFKLYAWPEKLSAVYPEFLFNSSSVLAASIAAAILIAITVLAFRSDEKVFKLSIIWFLVFLFPVLHFIPRINFVNDRYLYLPIIGLAGLTFTMVPAKIRTVVFVPLFILLGWTSFKYTEVWTSSLNLWKNAIEVVPENNMVVSNYALALQDAGHLEEASVLYGKIIGSENNSETVNLSYNNLANIYSNSKFSQFSLARSVSLLREGIAKTEKMRDTYEMRLNLGMLLNHLSQQKEAKGVLKNLSEDLKVEPDFRYRSWVPKVKSLLEMLDRESSPEAKESSGL